MTLNIAVLIDFENINSLVDVKTVLRMSEERGSVVAKKAFGNWSEDSIQQAQTELAKLGFELVHQVGIGKGRNGTDMKLVIDTMDLLHDKQQPVDEFVLATGDADFVPLVIRLRSAGKVVVAAGRPEVTSNLLKTTVDEFVPIGRQAIDTPPDILKDESKQASSAEEPRSTSAPRSPNDPTSPPPTAKHNPGASLDLATELLVLSAVFDLTLRDNEVIKGAPLHQTMKAIDPSFDFKLLGFAKFTDLLEAHPQLEVQGRGKQDDTTVTVKDWASRNDPTP